MTASRFVRTAPLTAFALTHGVLTPFPDVFLVIYAPRSKRRLARCSRTAQLAFCVLLWSCTRNTDDNRCEVYASEIINFSPGSGAGFGQDQLPDVVLGPPQGAQSGRGATDVLSLGSFGSITLALAERVRDAPDLAELVVFENPFIIAGTDTVYAEWGAVAVSSDGENFVPFPCDTSTGTGCAGRTPVHKTGNLLERGGDHFDLSDVGLESVLYVRISDVGAPAPSFGSGADGFDLDGVGVFHIGGGPECTKHTSPATP